MRSPDNRGGALGLNERVHAGRLLRAAALALVASIAVNVTISLLAVNALALPASFPPFNVFAVALFTTIGVGGATLALAALNRLVANPLSLFRVAAVAALVASLIPNAFAIADPTPMAAVFPGASSAAFAVLSTMHIVTAAIVVTLFDRARQ
jgi:hypothetical protein